jgi:diacylglycerol kinase (ATP)
LGLRRVRDSLAAWKKFCGGAGNVRAIDLGVITPLEVPEPATAEDSARSSVPGSRYFSCVAGVGLDGEVSARANRLPRWLRAHGGYVLSLAPTVFSFAPLSMKILTPREGAGQPEVWTTRIDQPTILAAIANTTTYGGGMKIAPQAKMDDGLLDVCIVGSVDPFKLFCMFPTVYSGRHLKIREVEYFQTERVRVETERALEVYADGEYVCRTPVEMSVHLAALKVVTSQSGSAKPPNPA